MNGIIENIVHVEVYQDSYTFVQELTVRKSLLEVNIK